MDVGKKDVIQGGIVYLKVKNDLRSKKLKQMLALCFFFLVKTVWIEINVFHFFVMYSPLFVNATFVCFCVSF